MLFKSWLLHRIISSPILLSRTNSCIAKEFFGHDLTLNLWYSYKYSNSTQNVSEPCRVEFWKQKIEEEKWLITPWPWRGKRGRRTESNSTWTTVSCILITQILIGTYAINVAWPSEWLESITANIMPLLHDLIFCTSMNCGDWWHKQNGVMLFKQRSMVRALHHYHTVCERILSRFYLYSIECYKN